MEPMGQIWALHALHHGNVESSLPVQTALIGGFFHFGPSTRRRSGTRKFRVLVFS